MKVARWGNSLGVRLPKRLVEAMKLRNGDDIQVRQAGDGTIEITREPVDDAALARMRALRRPLPPGFRFDRGAFYDEARSVRPDGEVDE